jgi:hypothetical protein
MLGLSFHSIGLPSSAILQPGVPLLSCRAALGSRANIAAWTHSPPGTAAKAL